MTIIFLVLVVVPFLVVVPAVLLVVVFPRLLPQQSAQLPDPIQGLIITFISHK